MFAFLRRPIAWIVIAVVVIAAGGGLFAQSQAKAKKEAAAKVAAASAPKSPFVAIANGKADVEGGMIQVAARRAGIVREVYVHEGLVATNFVAGQRLDQANDNIRGAEANLAAQRAAIATAQAALAQARYNQELTIIRAPADGRIARRYANPGAGASTLNVSTMFDLEPSTARIIRAEVAEGALPYVAVGQTVQMATESDPTHTYAGKVMRQAGVFGARKLVSDDPTERTDDRVVEVVVSADGAPFLIGQRVLVKFLRGTAVAMAPKM
jgi:multidrug resistance efflux pump